MRPGPCLGSPRVFAVARLSREADCGSGKGFQSTLSCESHVTSLPFKRTFQGPRTLQPGSPRAKEGGARSRYDQRGGVGALSHFAWAVITKVAGNPFSRTRDNEQELKGIRVEKSVNTRTTHSWSHEVYIKLCGSFPLRERVFS